MHGIVYRFRPRIGIIKFQCARGDFIHQRWYCLTSSCGFGGNDAESPRIECWLFSLWRMVFKYIYIIFCGCRDIHSCSVADHSTDVKFGQRISSYWSKTARSFSLAAFFRLVFFTKRNVFNISSILIRFFQRHDTATFATIHFCTTTLLHSVYTANL